ATQQTVDFESKWYQQAAATREKHKVSLSFKPQRALARAKWYRHRKGIHVLSRSQLLQLIKTLKAHHSKDPGLLKTITMETQESYAWNCPCGRLCGKKHAHCPDCQGHWTAGTPHSNRPKSPRAYANQEDWSWEWSADHQKRGRGAKQNQKAWTRSASARARAGKGKGKGKKTDVVSPFSQSTSTPWPSPETTLAFPTPFPQQTPTAPASTAQSSDANDIELMLAVKEQYPDITKAPARIQQAVAKAEKKTTPKQLTSGLHKTSSAVGNATKELQALKDAKAKHRERWLKHLHESVQCWEQQLKLYSEQQHNYNGLIKKARQDLATARQTLEDLNKKAAGHDEADPETAELEDTKYADTEATALAAQVQQVLQACAKAATKEETMEISDTEETTAPASKRQRSLEPFGGPPAGAIGADAYPFGEWGAASNMDLLASFTCPLTACHSAIWDPSILFTDTFTALGRAVHLRGEVLLASCLSASPAVPITTSSSSLMSEYKSSCRKSALTKACNKVHFCKFIEAYQVTGFASIEPLNVTEFFDEISLMARAPAQRPPSVSSYTDSDLEIHPPTSPESFEEAYMWNSVQVFDMRGNQDLDRAHVHPYLLLGHEDLFDGDERIAVLIDLELHGPNFESIIETDRYTTFVPPHIHREFLLRLAGVASYCQLQQDRCLVWHQGNLVAQQSSALLQVHHGDYLRIAAPPFDEPSIPTHFAVRACQAGFDRDQLISHFQQYGADDESLYTMITNEQNTPEVEGQTNTTHEEHDQLSNLQTAFRQLPACLISSKLPGQDQQGNVSCSLTEEFLQAIRARSQLTEELPQGPLPFPDLSTAPAFVRQLHEAHYQATAGVPPTADQQELRVETWFTDHARLQRCHIPRLVQLGPDFRTWEQQIRLEWIDHIDLRSEVEFYVVHPIPEDKDPTAVAQLILVQHADMRQSSIVLSIYDRAYDGGRPHSHAVVTADRVSLQSLISIAEFSEHCPPEAPLNDCHLRFGEIVVQPYQRVAVRHGFALQLHINRPREFDVTEMAAMNEDELRDALAQAFSDASHYMNTFSTANVTMSETIVPVDEHWLPDWHNSLLTAIDIDGHQALRDGSAVYVDTWIGDGDLLTIEARPPDIGQEEETVGLLQTTIELQAIDCEDKQRSGFHKIPLFLLQSQPPNTSLRNDAPLQEAPQFMRSTGGERPAHTDEAAQQFLPAGLSALREAFGMHAAVEVEEEGQVGFVETWFLTGERAYVTEESRTLRLDDQHHEWESQLRDLWRDVIDRAQPTQFYWVTPRPAELPTQARLGHLIVAQVQTQAVVPVHFTIQFAGLGHQTIKFAAALLAVPVRFQAARDLLQLARLCLNRRCRLKWRELVWSVEDAVQVPAGSGLEFLLDRVQDRVGEDDVINPDLPTTDLEPPEPLPPAHPPLHEHSAFIQELHDRWLDLAIAGPGGLEHILRVQTWYLEGGYIRHNDEQRTAVLGEDFW
ncbi:unnamed protein product, partial [Cladocopium goreaui]